MASSIASHEFLSKLKALCPDQGTYLSTPWYLVAAISFAASNVPDEVPRVFEFALNDLKAQSASEEDCKLLVRKMKDGIFKSGMLCGYPKAINGLATLHQVVPEQYRDDKSLRDTSLSIETLHKIGLAHFNETYGDTAETTRTFLSGIYPDFEFFCMSQAYGYVYGFSEVLSAAETSFAMVAALVATDVPRQIDWHLKGSVRNGASIELVKAVREISIQVAKSAGISWKNEIPLVE